MAEGAVDFSAVCVDLGRRQILRDITLAIEPKSTTALLGRSGSGKTTLLRTVNGLMKLTSGEVAVNGQSIMSLDPIRLRRGMGYVIQESGLFPHMTIGRNVALSNELAGRSKEQGSSRMEEVLGMTGLPAEEYQGRYPYELSGGQRQRVGLARALMSDPPILLMDEPFGALDPITRSEIQTMLHDLLQRVQKTVLLVTHDLEEALYLADRIIFLDQGRVVADLPSREVRMSQDPAVLEYVRAIRHADLTGDRSSEAR